MANVFFISDTHFGHEKTCTTFKRKDGSPLRPFVNAQEMDEEMVRRWNEVVKHDDKVYHLGDVVINQKFLPILNRLNGNKRLIRGNHDIFKTKDYALYFKEIYGVRVLEDMVLSHVPLHMASVTERWRVNVHGHYHANLVEKTVYRTVDNIAKLPSGIYYEVDMETVQIPDTLYENVCVEHTDYRPIELSELRARIKKNREMYGEPAYLNAVKG